MTQQAIRIADCAEHDIAAIQAIYAHYVCHSLATFETEPPTASQMLSRRDDILKGGHPYVTAHIAGRLAGYAYASSYRARPAYRLTVENSVYVAPGAQRCGVGRALMTALLDRCADLEFHTMVAVIGDSANRASISLHAAMGFSHVGTLVGVGRKFEQWVDTVIMQRDLTGGPPGR
ncbi:MAG TPA: GNAT family N-acetyltransferase [Ramlibacter sp.]|nr:GNAT family N-acetyltransferase [Ramlibacter sp.]